MGLTGDFGALGQLQDDLQFIAAAGFRRSLNAQLTETVRTLVAIEFESGIGPYGAAWAHPKYRDGQPLLATGRLRNSFGPDGSSESSFRFGTNVVYAGVHQYGATIRRGKRVRGRAASGRFESLVSETSVTIPQRQMLPEDTLPDAWLAEFEGVVDAEFDTIFGESR